MDETEKYQQRLEAIAEKRRQQEDQDRTRRELEDEKIRLQQLKRKSLRDQWLMEGPPLSPASPASPEPQSPRSPLWGSPTQESENHINTLQSKSLRLDEENEEQMEDASQAVRNLRTDTRLPTHSMDRKVVEICVKQALSIIFH